MQIIRRIDTALKKLHDVAVAAVNRCLVGREIAFGLRGVWYVSYTDADHRDAVLVAVVASEYFAPGLAGAVDAVGSVRREMVQTGYVLWQIFPARLGQREIRLFVDVVEYTGTRAGVDDPFDTGPFCRFVHIAGSNHVGRDISFDVFCSGCR